MNIDDKDIVSNTSVCVLQKGFACIKYSNIYNNAGKFNFVSIIYKYKYHQHSFIHSYIHVPLLWENN